MRPDPVGKPFRPARLGIGVVGCSQHRDEDMGAPLRPCRGVEYRHRVARKVDEQLLGGPMRLAHGRRDGFAPTAVELAEPAVAVAVRVLGPVLLPQQQQRNGRPLQFLVDVGPIGQRPRRLLVKRRRREQPPLQLGIVQSVGHRPGDADDGGAPQILANRRPAQPGRDGDLPLAHAKGVPQSQNFSNLSHRRSLGGHRTSPCMAAKEVSSAIRSPTSRASGRAHQGGRLRSEWVADFRRNRWPDCLGISGRFASDYASSDFRRS